MDTGEPQKLSLPRLKPILYLLCDICNEKVYNCKTCQNNWVVMIV